MAELLAELEPEHGETKIYRPYRDVRFSKDKSPYKTAIGAHVGDGYVQLSAAGLAAGSGMYGMAPDQLERYRDAVAADVERRGARRRHRHAAQAGHRGARPRFAEERAARLRRWIIRASSCCGTRASWRGRSGRWRAVARDAGGQDRGRRLPGRQPAARPVAGAARRAVGRAAGSSLTAGEQKAAVRVTEPGRRPLP